MEKAEYIDKNYIVDILTKSFDTNQSVNYIVKQDEKRVKRIRYLMDYSFEICFLYGDVFLSNDRKACALLTYPDKKKSSFKSTLLDIKLILFAVGLKNIRKTLARESLINKIHPKDIMYYLWFIGVDPRHQNKGAGTALLNEIIIDSEQKKMPIFLETSTLRNLPWYMKYGFEIYHELQLSYKLFFLKRTIKK